MFNGKGDTKMTIAENIMDRLQALEAKEAAQAIAPEALLNYAMDTMALEAIRRFIAFQSESEHSTLHHLGKRIKKALYESGGHEISSYDLWGSLELVEYWLFALRADGNGDISKSESEGPMIALAGWWVDGYLSIKENKRPRANPWLRLPVFRFSRETDSTAAGRLVHAISEKLALGIFRGDLTYDLGPFLAADFEPTYEAWRYIRFSEIIAGFLFPDRLVDGKLDDEAIQDELVLWLQWRGNEHS